MKNIKLVQTLAVFSKAEQRLFEHFLASPFFNKRADLIRLYEGILRQDILASKTKAYAYIYPDEPLNESKLRLAMTYLEQLAEEFLALQQWRNRPGATAFALSQAFQQRGLDAHCNQALKTARTLLSQQPLRNSDYHIWLGQLLWEEARYESAHNPTEITYLSHLSENADLVWLGQKLRYFCLQRTQRNMYKLEHSLPLRDEVETILHRYDLLGHTVIGCWYFCLKMLEEPDSVDYFNAFKMRLLAEGHCFNDDEIRDLHLFALNYCIRRVNDGQKQYFHDIMDFYKDGLHKGYLLDKGVLSRFTYHNIVAAGLQIQEFEWVESFISQYKNALERTHRESSYSFNLARLEYSRKRYDAALQLLQHSNYYDPLLGLAAKTISLKIYYELGEFDLLQAHLEALNSYIRRKAMLGYHSTNYLNIVRYTQKLISVNRFDKQEVAGLYQKIQAETVLTEKEWLLAQLE
jgi:hypothetical protein